MDTLLHINLSQQTALQRKMDVIANNMANMSTTAYKGEQVLCENFVDQFRSEEDRDLNEVNYLLDFGTIRSLEDGPVQVTQNPLDVALQGDGFLTVETDAGETLYTRRGHLMLNNENFLVLQGSGERVQDVNGNDITIDPQQDGSVTIAEDGTISGDQGQIAVMNLVRFEDERALERRGNALFDAADEAPVPVEELQLVQGAVEGSNVNPIKEVTEMIGVMRAYQSAQRAADRIDDLRERAIERLATVR